MHSYSSLRRTNPGWVADWSGRWLGDNYPGGRLCFAHTTAVIIGVIAGVVCYYAVALKNKLQWDDALDVWGVRGVGGFLEIVLLGVFADKSQLSCRASKNS